MKKTNSFPAVLVHGFLCFGDEEGLNSVCPNFGMWNGNAAKTIKGFGVDCFTPSVGPFSSAWDRACELYAKLVGGTVDFGKVHSEKYGHARFGRTHKALIPDWGQLDDDGRIKKINLIGHSFGGPTVRMFLHLLEQGSEEERAGTLDDELSPLFKGGKGSWVHSCTTLAATHEGVTLPDAGRPLVVPMQKLLFSLGSFLGDTPFVNIYDFHLDHFGMSTPKGKNKLMNFKSKSNQISHYISLNRDNIFYELSLKGGQEITKDFYPYDKTYYFSHAGNRTWKVGKSDVVLPTRKMFKPLTLFSLFECLYSNEKDASKPLVGKNWRPNDGLVNVESALAPKHEPQTFYTMKEDCKPGIWYKMPVEDMDHVSYMGIGETNESYSRYFFDIIDRVTDLPVID